MLRRWGPFRWWHGLFVSTDSGFTSEHFEMRFYGGGFWMFPLIVGWVRWKPKPAVPGGERR